MSEELNNENLEESIPNQPEESPNIPDTGDLGDAINESVDLDIGNTQWDRDIEKRSDLPDFEYDIDPPESD